MQLGKINKLKVDRITKFGTYLIDNGNEEVLLPDDYEGEVNLDDEIEVFIYLNNNEEYVATTKTPKITVNRFAFLEVKDVNNVGAFIDIGIDKELLVPYAEQTEEMYVGSFYLVFMYLDEETNRLVGSCKENDFVFFDEIDIKREDVVDLLLYRRTENGINAIVNNLYKGLIFESDIHKEINLGDQLKGFVKNVREDGKIDLTLAPIGYKMEVDTTSKIILEKLREEDGVLFLTDKSTPEAIKSQLGLSKKAFKRSLGFLYKKKFILILEDSIKLV